MAWATSTSPVPEVSAKGLLTLLVSRVSSLAAVLHPGTEKRTRSENSVQCVWRLTAVTAAQTGAARASPSSFLGNYTQHLSVKPSQPRACLRATRGHCAVLLPRTLCVMPGLTSSFYAENPTGFACLSSGQITAPGREPRSATPVRLWWFPSTDYREPAHDLRMYEKIVIILLLSGYISTQNVSETTAHELPSLVSTEKPSLTTSGAGQEPLVTRHQQFPGARQQISHTFSEPAIIGIIYAVMLGIIITILSFAFCIGQLTKKSSLPVQSSSPEDADSEVL
ncbi:glycophorin-A [Callorhinus ursinus]|uniref:glycophorin-A n=1 Tax=Callorhinus ursinus TaxID=34884 RepID=UPI003CD024FE